LSGGAALGRRAFRGFRAARELELKKKS